MLEFRWRIELQYSRIKMLCSGMKWCQSFIILFGSTIQVPFLYNSCSVIDFLLLPIRYTSSFNCSCLSCIRFSFISFILVPSLQRDFILTDLQFHSSYHWSFNFISLRRDYILRQGFSNSFKKARSNMIEQFLIGCSHTSFVPLPISMIQLLLVWGTIQKPGLPT